MLYHIALNCLVWFLLHFVCNLKDIIEAFILNFLICILNFDLSCIKAAIGEIQVFPAAYILVYRECPARVTPALSTFSAAVSGYLRQYTDFIWSCMKETRNRLVEY